MGRTAIALAVTAATSLTIGCGSDFKPNVPFVGETPAVYVAKVKNILVGLPPTDAEIAAVVADPNALGGLVDSWMATPQYQQKMMVFFELAFQQTQISIADFTDLPPPNGMGTGRALPALVQNISESFARTVLEMNAEGQPFNDAFTTSTLMMTPALMELYGFLDAHRADDNAKITDSFAKANPTLMITMGTAIGPIAMADSLDPTNTTDYMHWYSPDVATGKYGDTTCEGIDPVTFAASALSMHELLYGEIPAHAGPSGNCPGRSGATTQIQLDPTDFTTWKMVKIRLPNAGEQPTTFYDMPTLRSATELVVGTPHPGFFSTPAFFANWPTNSSNQMRATVNQALIVATGTAVDGTDSTTPGTTPGLDATHAAPGSACFGCHQLLDPTRSILSATYSWFYYPQTDPTLIAQPGLFAFQNVIAPMHNINDFATLLSTHPLVAQAWAQKLCYYANSAPCIANDPAFTQIVGDFSNGFSFNNLVREIMISPITTYATETVTGDTNGEVIAVTRRDHLCAMLNNRLGLVDICQLDQTLDATRTPSTLAQIVSGMPSDGYGRGATIPVLPNQPTLFYRAGVENICEDVAALVVDAKANASQPGAKMYTSTQPDAAIADFAANIMALPPSDPRNAQAVAVLTQHFMDAQQPGATSAGAASASDALKSTFVAACLSPTFIGIGM